MWVLIFLYTLGINTCQATDGGNSTQMYYATLTIDQSVFMLLQKKLVEFSVNDNSLVIKDLQMTTNCTNDTNSATQQCDCMSGYKWDDNVCQSNLSCCGKTSCDLPIASHLMCISDTAVDVTGTITLSGNTYQECLTEQTLQSFKDCNSKLLSQMKSFYSTLPGFDTLRITSYSIGSIIVNFGMRIVSDIKSEQLINKSIEVSSNLSGSINLETTGILTIIFPNKPVHYKESANITCKAREDLGYSPQWSLKTVNQESVITNGTVSSITTKTQNTTITLNKVDELWKGEYKCLYMQQKNTTTIKHKASGTMKICLQPSITTSTNPAFPRCKSKDDVLSVTIICQIGQTTEDYMVTWSAYAEKGKNSSDGRVQTFTATKIISCDKSSTVESVQAAASCNFTNECQQTSSRPINFTIIYPEDSYCGAEGDWGDTKVGFTAEKACLKQAGVRKRSCLISGTWKDEVSECVNQDLSDVLQKAVISDIGLGELNTNAATVFSHFQNITKMTNLNSFSNLNSSVQVLSTMQPKLLSINDDLTINNMLQSSSNLLNESLLSSWTTTSDNSSLANLYLSSIESLVMKSNITERHVNSNLQVVSCSNKTCINTVFNAIVQIENSNTVKTIGFQNLQNYLPNNNSNDSKPNSIVVSTTMEGTQNPATVITINFTLIHPRPRNVQLTCAYWDNNTMTWSSEGCKWSGSKQEGQCICTHLSSFAILLSNHPVEVPQLDKITYVGLGVSVVSLFICLVIELMVWSDVVKTNTLYLRHTAHVNIALCLLVADACFLGSSNQQGMTDIWCKTSVVLKHFCYLAMFFWMLCLSFTLLHQAVFLFHKVSKKNYLRFSLVVGYGCPLIIVFVTFLTCNAGADGVYYSSNTCWLIYNGLLKGSIYTFVIPAATIVIVNIFSMVVVIMKLLSAHHQHADITQEKEKAAAKTVLRSVILLTPIFGVTWVFGFALEIFDLADGIVALVINYLFVLLNTFQGFFILLTSYLCDRMTREALMKYFKKKAPAASSMSESTTKLDTSFKK